ncbi:MAG: ExbD/TolR family protein [Sphingobacteriia bacterium]|jgi:biopolymer transport protein ExbD
MAAAVDGGGDSGGKKGKRRGKKGVPPIDMTPMVDLGFLLLTFFILTATLSDPKSMPIVVPSDEIDTPKEEKEKVAESKVMNIIIAGQDRIYYYMGKSDGEEGGVELRSINYGKGIRTKIQENQEQVKKRFATAKDPDPMIVLIKMAKDARYENMVNILDEMNVTNQKKYMLLDLEREEAEFVQAYEESQNLTPSAVAKTLAAGAGQSK